MRLTKILRPFFFSVAFLLWCGSVTHASSGYSRYGYGLLYLRDGVKVVGMGGAGIGIADSLTIFYLNPAALAGIRTTHIQAGAIYDRATTTLEGSSALFHDVSINGLGILIPLKRGYAMSFGLQPYSEVNFAISAPDTVDGKAVVEALSGSGGLNLFYLAVAFTMGRMQIGLATDFYFGLIRETWRADFSSGDLTYTEDRVERTFRGFGLHAGVHSTVKKMQWGLAWGIPVTLKGETRVDTRYASDSNPKPVKSKLPFWYGGGLAYGPNRHWVLAAQARVQHWGEMSSAELLGATGVNNYILGAGLEFAPGSDRLREGRGLRYRAGANYSLLPYREASSGAKIPEWTVTAGFGVPFNRGSSSVDFAFEWGQRGNSSNLVQENILRFSASINGSERWFQRRR